MIRAAVAFLLLTACTPVPDAAGPRESFRDPDAVIGSQVNVAAADLAGDWVVRFSYLRSGLGFGDGGSVMANGADLTFTHEGFTSSGEGEVGAAVFRSVYRADGPGRWRYDAGRSTNAQNTPAPEKLWIFWLDGDHRTMAIGNPEGTFAQILDRSARGGGDRIAAAREILDWYGFDVAGLSEL